MHATLKGGKKIHMVQRGVRNNLGFQLKNATGSTYHKETLCTCTTHMLQQSCNNLILLLWKCGKDEDGIVQQCSFRGTVMYTASNAAYCVGRCFMHFYHAFHRSVAQHQEARSVSPSTSLPASRLSGRRRRWSLQEWLHHNRKERGTFACLFRIWEKPERGQTFTAPEKKKLHSP